MAIATGPVHELTAEEILGTVEEGRFELIDGELKEKTPMGAEANLLAIELIIRLTHHVRPARLGMVLGIETGFQIFPHETRRVRYPDVAFVPAEGLAVQKPPRGLVKVAPELVVEIVSPNDIAEDINTRLSDFLRAGVPLLWVVYPMTRQVHIFRTDGTANWMGTDGVLDGEDVLPGFSCPVAELFSVIDGDPGPSA
jgi:Uma2 family endonuclease